MMTTLLAWTSSDTSLATIVSNTGVATAATISAAAPLRTTTVSVVNSGYGDSTILTVAPPIGSSSSRPGCLPASYSPGVMVRTSAI